MEHDFWHQRWQKKEIGWHNDEFHPALVALAHKIFPVNSTVFVPLCGKSKDMAWLAENGYQVIGSELSEIAVEEFFKDVRLKPTVSESGSLTLFEAGPYKIYQGDFFDLRKEQLVACETWYDRAAVIALPESLRAKYVEKLSQLFSKGAQGLVISLSYQSQTRQGPPFSVNPEQINNLWNQASSVKHKLSSDVEMGVGKGSGQLPKFKPTDVEEHIFEISI